MTGTIGTLDLHHHGDAELAPGLLDLAVNVAPGLPPAWLSTAILSACGRLDRYPDAAPATAATAARHGRRDGEVLLTAGAAEAFTLAAQGLPRGRAAVVHPQFTEPEAALRAAGWDIHRVLLAPGEQLDARRVPEDAALVVIGNPTNPTGTLHHQDSLLALRRPGRVVLIDEAFLDAVPGEPETLAGIADPTGLLVTRSLTKTWGLAGLRIGYLLGDPAAIAACGRVQPHWPVSTPALAAAAACATPQARAEAKARARRLTAAAQRLRGGLARRGFELVPGAVGPFVLTRHPERPNLHTELRQHAVAVRRADTFPGLDDPASGWVRIGVRDEATNHRLLDTLDRITDRQTPAPGPVGSVTLVGGGPGAAGAVTVDGLLALSRADVIVTDRLAPRQLLDHLPEHVQVVDAAKTPGGPAMPQTEINTRLAAHATAGQHVVRLKGGDPFIFGRGGEEIQACAAAGIATGVLPGVSSATAGPAAMGIPVTHRGLAHGVTVISGHLPPGHPDSLLDWAALARSGTTLVVLMGVATLPAITTTLRSAGLSAATPAAVIAAAGHPGQRQIRSALGSVAAAAAGAHIEPPAVLVIGAVAGMELS
jgi:histidinol-phosphate aminotransferase